MIGALEQLVGLTRTLCNARAVAVLDPEGDLLASSGETQKPEQVFPLEGEDGAVLGFLTVSPPPPSTELLEGCLTLAYTFLAEQQRKRALEDENHLLWQVVDSTPSALYVKEADGRISLANTALARAYGMSKVELLALSKENPRFYARPDEVESALENDALVFEGGETFQFEEHATRPDGTQASYLSTKTPFTGSDGIQRLLCITTDITATKKLEARLTMLERALESVSDAISISELGGKVVYLNPAAQRRYGADLENTKTLTQATLTPEAYKRMEQQILSGKPFSGETHYITPEGDEVSLLIRADPILSVIGQVVAVVGTTTDLSEVRRLEGLLELFHLAVESSSDSISLVQLDGKVLYMNAAAEELVGYRREDFSGTERPLLLPTTVSRQIFKALHSGESIALETTLRDYQGTEHTVHLRAQRLPSKSNGSGVFVISTTDLTEAKRLEQLREGYVAMAGHELRTPLSAIQGALELVTEGILGEISDEARELLSTALESAERLARLVTDILSLARLKSEQLIFRNERLELYPLLERGVREQQFFAESSGVSLVLSGEEIYAELEADPDRVMQVLVNLISNAVKFSPSGSRVNVALLEREGRIRVEVRDRGPGISAEFRGRIFGRFARALDTQGVGGTGLGLSISRSIVERLGGTLGFEDREGGGTVFYFELPRLSVEVSPKP